MRERDGYPSGVPCWVDIFSPDLDAAMAFYGEVFGWSFVERTPPGAPQRYAMAQVDGFDVAGLGWRADAPAAPAWTMSVAVDDADAVADAVVTNGGRVLEPPADVPHAGRSATCADPDGAPFGLWQARARIGAQLVNEPRTWNFNDLVTDDPTGAEAFYGTVLGWEAGTIDLGGGPAPTLWRRPGYGEHLAARDPEIRARQAEAQAPPGFADAVGWMSPLDGAPTGDVPHWTTTFAVDDTDAVVARSTAAGGTVVVPPADQPYVRVATLRDPQGAAFIVSRYQPPE